MRSCLQRLGCFKLGCHTPSIQPYNKRLIEARQWSYHQLQHEQPILTSSSSSLLSPSLSKSPFRSNMSVWLAASITTKMIETTTGKGKKCSCYTLIYRAHVQGLYHFLFLILSSSSFFTAKANASFLSRSSRSFLSCNIFIPATAAAIPFASSLRLFSHQVYIPILATAKLTTA